MYEEFYGFIEKPFQIVPNPDYLYMSSKHEAALTYLEYGLEQNVGFILLTGEIGSGKTTLINYLLKQIESNIEVAVLFNTNVTSDELLNLILQGFDLKPDESNKAANLDILYTFLIDLYGRKKRAVLVIDEAQNLSKETLEEVRMLSNLHSDDHMLLQILLVGQPELRIRLRDPGFAQFSQRIAVSYHLNALTLGETIKYIAHRLNKAGGRTDIFTSEAINAIFRAAAGIPRTINLICDSSLVYGFAEELMHIDARITEMVIKELGIIGVYSPTDRRSRPDRRTPSPAPNTVKKDVNGILPRLKAVEDRVRQLQTQMQWYSEQYEKRMHDARKELGDRLKDFLLIERKYSDSLLSENTRLKMMIKALQEAREKDQNRRLAPKNHQKQTDGEQKEKKPSPGNNIRSLHKV
jgi:general secretion pathway protein A